MQTVIYSLATIYLIISFVVALTAAISWAMPFSDSDRPAAARLFFFAWAWPIAVFIVLILMARDAFGKER